MALNTGVNRFERAGTAVVFVANVDMGQVLLSVCRFLMLNVWVLEKLSRQILVKTDMRWVHGSGRDAGPEHKKTTVRGRRTVVIKKIASTGRKSAIWYFSPIRLFARASFKGQPAFAVGEDLLVHVCRSVEPNLGCVAALE